MAHLDLAETKINWFKSHSRGSVCDLCKKGTEDFKYGAIERKDRIKALEDFTEKLFKWKKPGQAYVIERKYEKSYDSMVDQRRMTMWYHGLDVEPCGGH